MPSKQLLLTLSPVLKNVCCKACCAVRRFSGSYSSKAASSLYPSCPSEALEGKFGVLSGGLMVWKYHFSSEDCPDLA